MTNHKPREYHVPITTISTDNTFIYQSLFVRDQAQPISERRMREHLDAVHTRLVDRLGALVAQQITLGRHTERELRFMLDELLEAIYRLEEYAEKPKTMVS